MLYVEIYYKHANVELEEVGKVFHEIVQYCDHIKFKREHEIGVIVELRVKSEFKETVTKNVERLSNELKTVELSLRECFLC